MVLQYKHPFPRGQIFRCYVLFGFAPGLDDLMSRLSLEEKIKQITPDASLGGVNPSSKKTCFYHYSGMRMDNGMVMDNYRERCDISALSSRRRQNIGAEHYSIHYSMN